VADYSSLPWTGKALLCKDHFCPNEGSSTTNAGTRPSENEQNLSIDEDIPCEDESDNESSLRDSVPTPPLNQPSNSTATSNEPLRKKRKRPSPLPAPRKITDFGSYLHLGLEKALKGDSIGLFFKNAELTMLASVYKKHPEYINAEMRQKVSNTCDCLIITLL